VPVEGDQNARREQDVLAEVIDLLETQALPMSSPLRGLSVPELDDYGADRWGEDWLRDVWRRRAGQGVYHMLDEMGRALCLDPEPASTGDELCDDCARAASQIERLKRSMDDGLPAP
jgi:hypothetical protein